MKLLIYRCGIMACALALVLGWTAASARDAGPNRHDAVTSRVNTQLPDITPGKHVTLGEALSAADQRSPSLAAARADIARARADLERSWAVLIPSAKGTLTHTHNDHEDTTTFSSGSPDLYEALGIEPPPSREIVVRRQDDLSGALQVSAPIINAQSWMNVHATRMGVEVSRLTVENVRQELLMAVAQTYYQALNANALIKVQEAQFYAAVRHMKVAMFKYESGVGQRLDYVRARTEVVNTRQSLLAAHSALDNARDALGVLTGLGGLPYPSEAPRLDVPVEDEKELVSKAHNQRTDLRAKRAGVEMSRRQLEASWMQFLPTLDATWQLTHRFTDPSGFGSTEATRWAAVFMLTVPIYNQIRYADLDRNRALLKKARLEAEDAKQSTAMEVRRAGRDFHVAMAQVNAAEEQVVLTREATTLAEAAYESGTGDSLAVTDARRSSREAEVMLATRRFEAQLALLQLMRSVGVDMAGIAERNK